MRRDSFLRGAFILMIGSLVSRILGAVYRFILPWMMGGGDDGAYGMALFGLPYSIYSIALVLSTLGIPLAVSKLVSEAEAGGSVRQARRVFRISVGLLAMTGAVFALALYVVTPYFVGQVWQNPDAYPGMVALAPAVFFVAIMSAFRGLFQGLQSMTPHAVSQIVEQIIRVGTMFILVAVLVPYGLEYAAAGATFGATTGAIAGAAYLVWVYFRNRKAMWGRFDQEEDGGGQATGLLVKRILMFAIPISVSGLILPLMRVVDAAVVPFRLIDSGYSVTAATTAYGYLESYSMPFVNVPAIFTTAIAISLVPSVSASLAKADFEGIRNKAFAALRISGLIGVPSAVGLLVLAPEIPALFWNAPEAGPVLASVSFVALFLGLQQVSAAVLQGIGRPWIPMMNLMVGALVKLILTWVLTGVPTLGVLGAGVASVVAFTVAVSLNFVALTQRIGWFNVGRMFWRPVVGAGFMALGVRLSVNFLSGHLGTLAGVAGGLVFGVAIYGILILLIGGIRRSDLLMIPRVGERLAAGLKASRLLRD